MKNEFSDNDEPIHHSEGKDLLYSCPSEPPIASPDNTPKSPIFISPPLTISPPDMMNVLEQ